MGEERWRVGVAVYSLRALGEFTLAGEERMGVPGHAPGLEHPRPHRHTHQSFVLFWYVGLL